MTTDELREAQWLAFADWLVDNGLPVTRYGAALQRLALLEPNALGDDPVRLRFGQSVILDCGPVWGGDHHLIVGWVERTESLSVSGEFASSSASREYVLQDGLDAPSPEAVNRLYQREPEPV